jgi:transcriptional regulator with XRE-family HTH domain
MSDTQELDKTTAIRSNRWTPASRLHLGRTREIVAKSVEISVTQLVLYESGQGHPPALTLHQIARTLGTSTSALLGETMAENPEQVDEMMTIFSHPQIGAVLRYMQDMTKEERKTLQVIASAFANRAKPAETVEVAASSPREQPIRSAMAPR